MKRTYQTVSWPPLAALQLSHMLNQPFGAVRYKLHKQVGHRAARYFFWNHHNSGAFSNYNRLQLSGCMRLDTALGAGLRWAQPEREWVKGDET